MSPAVAADKPQPDEEVASPQNHVAAGGGGNGEVPPLWSCCSWMALVRPRFLLAVVFVGAAAVLVAGLAGILLGASSICDARTAEALNHFSSVKDRIEDQMTIKTLPVSSLGTFVRQTPFFPELVRHFDSIAADLLRGDTAVENIQLVPSGVVSAAYPPGNEGSIGHDLFEDPDRRGDVLRAVESAPGMSISNPLVLTREGQSGRAIFARYPVFVDGPVANRTEAFGVPDAYECGDLCYGDPDSVFWGLTTGLVDFDELLEGSGLTTLEVEEGACFVLRTGRVFQATDQVSTNNTIYSSDCVASRPVVLPVAVPNDQWFLEIGFPGECTPWVVPAVVVFVLAVLVLVVLLLLFVHQSVANRMLVEARHSAEVGQLRERQRQIAREEASLGSDAVRLLVASLSQQIHSVFKPMMASTVQSAAAASLWDGSDLLEDEPVHGTGAKRTSSSSSTAVGLSSVMFSRLGQGALGKKCTLVTAKVHGLDAMKVADPTSCRAMLSSMRRLIEDLVGAMHGECLAMHESAFIMRFRTAERAVAAALQLRKALLESTWPEAVLALPGCGPHPMATALQGDAKGPQLQTVIDLEAPECSEHILLLADTLQPRMIVITADVWMQLATIDNMAAAGFPDVEHLGTVACPEGEVAHILFEVNDPIWDFRLPQLPRHRRNPNFTMLAPAVDNVWELPIRSDDGRTHLAVVALKLGRHSKAVKSQKTPTKEMLAKMGRTIKSMRLLFGGTTLTLPATASESSPCMIAFPDSDCAMAFSACLQLALLHAAWTEEEVAIWGNREVGMLGKLTYAGPRIKCAIHLQPRAKLEGALPPMDATAAAAIKASIPLLKAAYSGQVLASAEAVALAAVMLGKADRVRVVDLGEHLLGESGEPVGLKELQVVDVDRTFPPPRTFKVLSPSFHMSPDPSQPCAFVYSQAVCAAGTKISSSQAYAGMLASWRELAVRIAAPLLGYEILDKGPSLAYAFQSLEAGMAFAVLMQEALLEMPVPTELAQHEAFAAKLGSAGQVLHKGLLVKTGISFGVPVMRRPTRSTGRANYHGPVVLQGARTMLSACPGQVLLGGGCAMNTIGVPPSAFDATLRDEKLEPLVVSNETLSEVQCEAVHVRVLGFFKQEGADNLPLADIVLPKLSERVFSQPPGRIGAAAAPDVSAEGGRGSGDARAARGGPEPERTLATVLNDILHERITYKGPEEKVQILGVLGRGMQGKVMLGKWKGVDVAYKVVQLPMAMSQQDSAHTRAMLEMAISATMAHPNVVQTYSYEMVYVEAESPFTPPPPTAEALTEGGAEGEADVNVDSVLEASVSLAEQDEPLAIQAAGHHEARLIQELCDRKTLRYNLDKKKLVALGEELPQPGVALMLAHDVACGMQHIHSQNIIHGDLKALNVLLTSSMRKTAASGSPNVLAKVADFGLSERLSTEQTHVSNVHSGTVSHMAPEVLLAGQLSKASDVYAFGMLLYELFSGRRPFEKLTIQQVTHQAGTLGKRPVFPPDVPVRVIELACACWGPAPGRPSFAEVVPTLAALLKDHKAGLFGSRRGTRTFQPDAPRAPSSTLLEEEGSKHSSGGVSSSSERAAPVISPASAMRSSTSTIKEDIAMGLGALAIGGRNLKSVSYANLNPDRADSSPAAMLRAGSVPLSGVDGNAVPPAAPPGDEFDDIRALQMAGSRHPSMTAGTPMRARRPSRSEVASQRPARVRRPSRSEVTSQRRSSGENVIAIAMPAANGHSQAEPQSTEERMEGFRKDLMAQSELLLGNGESPQR